MTVSCLPQEQFDMLTLRISSPQRAARSRETEIWASSAVSDSGWDADGAVEVTGIVEGMVADPLWKIRCAGRMRSCAV